MMTWKGLAYRWWNKAPLKESTCPNCGREIDSDWYHHDVAGFIRVEHCHRCALYLGITSEKGENV